MGNYLTVSELTEDQILVLKQEYLCQHYEECEDRSPTWSELAEADRIVDDAIIFEVYGGTLFSPEEFL